MDRGCNLRDWDCLRAQWSSRDTASKALLTGWLFTCCVLACLFGTVLRHLKRRRFHYPVILLVSSPTASATEVGSGKTTLFWQLVKGRCPQYPPVPSQEPNEGIVTLQGTERCLLVDLPSDARTRPTWGKFKTLEKASPAVLVYVVDANKESLRRETEYLFRDLNVETLIHRGVTCIVLANKSDLRTAMPPKVFQARFLKEWERLQQAETRSAPQMPAVDAHAKQESSKDVMQRLVLFHGSAKTGEGLSALRMVFHQALHPKRR